jgi:teichuronic acid biosynthesis glycosyltransferase TuaG
LIKTRKPNQSNPNLPDGSQASNPLISVVIPLYNAEKYIGETLESVFAQTYNPFEVIVVNDGSTDSSLSVVRKYPDVKVISQTNQGEGITRNNGVAVSKGDFIAFLDADDLWEKHKLEEQMNTFFSYPELSVVTNLLQEINENGEDLKTDIKLKVPYDTPFNPYDILISEGNPTLNMSGAIIKKNMILSVGGFRDIRLSTDYDFWIRLSAEGSLFYVISKKLTKYRLLNNSLIHGSLEKEYGSQLNILELNKSRYNRITSSKRKSKIYYDWADSAFCSRDSTVWFAVIRSIFYNPFNYKIYLLVIRGLIKKLISY